MWATALRVGSTNCSIQSHSATGTLALTLHTNNTKDAHFFLFPALNQLIIIIICPERKAPTKRIHNQHKQIQCNRFICDFRQLFVFVFYIFSPNCGLDVQSAHVILSLCPEFSFRILLIPFMTSPQSGVVAHSRCMYALLSKSVLVL